MDSKKFPAISVIILNLIYGMQASNQWMRFTLAYLYLTISLSWFMLMTYRS